MALAIGQSLARGQGRATDRRAIRRVVIPRISASVSKPSGLSGTRRGAEVFSRLRTPGHIDAWID